MNYRIKITKTEPNPTYKEEMERFEKDMRWGSYSKQEPALEVVKDVLICELTEEQYKKVKAEVYKVFE